MYLHSLVRTNSSQINNKYVQTFDDELQFDITKEVFWTDSQVVLSYIKNQKSVSKFLVANSIQKIKYHSKVAQWQYVPSKSNPADYESRLLDGI